MAIARIRRASNWEHYDEGMEASGGRQKPPEGLIIHAAGEVDGVFQVIDIWESQEVAERYEREVANPIAARVAGEDYQVPEPTTYELYEVVRGQ